MTRTRISCAISQGSDFNVGMIEELGRLEGEYDEGVDLSFHLVLQMLNLQLLHNVFTILDNRTAT